MSSLTSSLNPEVALRKDRRTCLTCLSYPSEDNKHQRVCLFIGIKAPATPPKAMPCKGECHATRLIGDGPVNIFL